MKKILLFILVLTFAFTLVSCDFLINIGNQTEESESSNFVSETETTTKKIDEVDSQTTITTSSVETTIEITTNFTSTNTETFTETNSSTITTDPTNLNEPFIPSGYSLLQDELVDIGIPSIGDSKVLVFVVDFPDDLIVDETTALQDTFLAFNGTSEELTFESLNSYYQISSFNQLNITADVFGVYTAEYDSSYYEQANEDFYAYDEVTGEYLYPEAPHPDSDIIYELLTYYDNDIDYNEYDGNNDGYIDGIYVIYNHDISYDSGSDLWWAYQYYYMYYDTFDGVSPNYYVWSGIDFFYEGEDNVNARTIIHETGHMLGLEDYYDYYEYDAVNEGGLGTFMMDYTVGDHDVFSKILLGWITPRVIDKSMTVDILPHLENGDVLLVIDEWKNTIFDEYFLIMYYTPEGLNELDQNYMFTQEGIIIFHVSAAIDNGYNDELYYYSIFNNNNTDTEDKLINIIEADMDEDIERYATVENSDLFLLGDAFGYDIYPGYTWYDDIPINLYIEIVELNEALVTIEIYFY